MLDSVPPVIICPISFSVSTCEGVQHIVEYAITWGDNCTSSDPVLVSGLPSGSVFPVGTTVINWSVGDQSGNMSDCSFSVTIAVTELEALIPTSTLTCPGESTGTATALVLNGTPPFTYLWDDPQAQATATAINLAEGTYTVQVTDVFGCEATASVIIEAYPQIVVQIQSVTDETNGLANGSIEINVIGGSPPYSYEWSKDGLVFSAAEDPDGLSEGGYTVKITDAVGCTFTSEVIVVDNITGVGELNGQNRYRIFPNPGSDFFWVEWRGPVQGDLRAELLDINGKVHLKSALKTARTQLDTHGLTPGVYLLCLYADGWKATEKVLIIR